MIVAAKTQIAYVLVRKSLYDRVRELLEDEQNRKVQEGWQKLAYRGLALSLEDDA